MKKTLFVLFLLLPLAACASKNQNIPADNAQADQQDTVIQGSVDDKGRIIMKDVKFDKDSDKMSNSSEGVLQETANYLKDNTEVTLNVACYNADDGTPAYCVDLSKKRAKNITDKLKSYGVDESRINLKGKQWVAPEVSEQPDENVEMELVH